MNRMSALRLSATARSARRLDDMNNINVHWKSLFSPHFLVRIYKIIFAPSAVPSISFSLLLTFLLQLIRWGISYSILFRIHFWRLNLTTGVTNLSWSGERKKKATSNFLAEPCFFSFGLSLRHRIGARAIFYQHFADAFESDKVKFNLHATFCRIFKFSVFIFWARAPHLHNRSWHLGLNASF